MAEDQTNLTSSNEFCGSEERVSTHTCNSIFPAVTVDTTGKQGIVWHDTRDGVFEIYMKILDSKVSPLASLESDSSELDPKNKERTVNLSCSGFSAGYGGPTSPSGLIDLSQRCSSDDSASVQGSNVLTRVASSRLDVNSSSLVAILSTESFVDFYALGIVPGVKVRIDTGYNAGKEFVVKQVLSKNVLDLLYLPTSVSDSGFIVSVLKTSSCSQTKCEFRLTCDNGASLFPDIVSDKDGRYHIVYQDDTTGVNQLYYIQVADKSLVGLKRGCYGPVKSAGEGSFAEIQEGSGGVAITVGGVTKFYQSTGENGQFFAYGNKLFPSQLGNRIGDPSSWTGLHTLFRDYFSHNGKWLGLSASGDRTAWNEQAIPYGSPTPTVVIPSGHPVAAEGDFGSTYDFDDIGFMVKTPPDKDVMVRTVSFPFKVRCAPKGQSVVVEMRTSDLVESPKIPMPPNFLDPIDISKYLASPRLTIDPSVPARFTLQGDPTGTIYTNMLLQTAPSEFVRLIFQKPDKNQYKFILGQSRCNLTACADKVPEESSEPRDQRYKIKFQAWQGSDYRIDPTQIASAAMTSQLLLEKDFYFSQDDDLATFTFDDGDLRFPAGSIVFLVASSDDDRMEFEIEAVGEGHSIWTTSGYGNFDQYYVPWTMPLYKGLSASPYYDGRLIDPTPSYAISSVSGFSTVSGFSGTSGAWDLPWGDFLERDLTGSPPVCINQKPMVEQGPSNPGSFISSVIGAINFRSTFKFNSIQSTVVDMVSYVGPYGSGRSLWQWFFPNCAIYIPEDQDKYGPLSGKILAGCQRSLYSTIPNEFYGFNLQSVDGVLLAVPNSSGQWLKLTDCYTAELGINAISMFIIQGSDFLGISDNSIYTSTSAPWLNSVGDLALAEANGNLWVVKWNNSTNSFDKTLVAKAESWKCISFSTSGASGASGSSGFSGFTGASGFSGSSEFSGYSSCFGQYVSTLPFQMTLAGPNERPRLSIDRDDNIWVTWHSKRSGYEEVFVSRYFSECGVWDTPTSGGREFQISTAGINTSKAMFPSISVDKEGEAHVVFQSNDTPDGRWEIFYARTTGGGAKFLPATRITQSSGDALMPDIAIGYDLSGKKIHVCWHDNRNGNFEIMSAVCINGSWKSSGQGSLDVRITNSVGDSMFPRMSPDKDGNIRLVFHSNRVGEGKNAIFMSTYSNLTEKWLSSGQNGTDRMVSQGPLNSLFPDISIDIMGGVGVVWHDDRHTLENADQHEEIYAIYCPRLGQAEGAHFLPLVSNIETKLDVSFEIIDCSELRPIDFTNVPEVCIKIKAPGATFWRAKNEDGEYGDWEQFKPSYDINTTIVPWKLTCGNGLKQVCIQIQDAQSVGFPICKNIILVSPEATFEVNFFEDEAMSNILPTYKGWPIAKSGTIYALMTANEPQVLPPLFDVVGRGIRYIYGQESIPIDVSGFSSSSNSLSNFAGSVIGGSAFSAYAGQRFLGRFDIKTDDGIFNRDGLTRLIVRGRNLCSGGSIQSVQSVLDPCGTFFPSAVSGFSSYVDPLVPPAPEPPPDHEAWVLGTRYLWLELPAYSYYIRPTSFVTYPFRNGGIAQPFVAPAMGGPLTSINLLLARRADKDSTGRSLTLEIVKDFNLPTETTVFSQEIQADVLPGVLYDPVTLSLLSPSTLSSVTVILDSEVILNSGSNYAVIISDYSYYRYETTMGIDALMFVCRYGTPGTPSATINMYTRVT